MGPSPLSYHAAAPGGWINDPNALIRGPDGWTLMAQHRADGPGWQATGWGRFTSPDLLAWTWQGPAIDPTADSWAYSGCVVRDGSDLVTVHTAHAPGPPARQSQVARRRRAGESGWSVPEPLDIPALAARRDPFLWRTSDGWRMALARPCPWDDWAEAPASLIELWGAADFRQWQLMGTIGPWDPPGILWEVPIVVPGPGAGATLLLSRVDRRGGRARSDVHWWHGRLTDDGFKPAATGPLDLGPDFYAATVAVDDPGLLMGWLSSWDIARAMPWPGFAGGPVSLPRQLSVADGRVRATAAPGVVAAFARPLPAPPAAGCGVAAVTGGFRLEIRGDQGRLVVTADPRSGDIVVERQALPPFDWAARHPAMLGPVPVRTLRLFVDGPVIELFLEPDGLVLSAALPTAGPLSVALAGGRFDWFGR